jgi:release factor glutamine methyltransferase
MMRTVLEILSLSTDYLKQKNIQFPRRQAEELLGEALGLGRMGLYLAFDRPVTEKELEKCRSWLKRRAQGEPLQYISGKVQFLDCEIFVTPDVLIPRQETEILADKIIKELSPFDLQGKILWDVCCGSGCIGIALKKQLPALKVALSDISKAALSMAKKNALHNNIEVEFFEGDLLAPFGDAKTDYVICNPPYVAESEYKGLDVEVRGYEPKLALVAGDQGLSFYQRLADELPKKLKRGGKVWLEIGDKQGEAVKALFNSPLWKNKSVSCDWSGRERFFSLEIE